MKKISRINTIILASVWLVGCTEVLEVSAPDQPIKAENNDIRVGGVTTDFMSVSGPETRSTVLSESDAEEQEWLIPALKAGLDISYGLPRTNANGQLTEENKHVAILKLLTNSDGTIKKSTYTENGVVKSLAEYSFCYKTTEGGVTAGETAKWYDNGPHFFEGVYVPEELRNSYSSKPLDLTTDQSGDNYTYLSHYLGMPADCRISATISRIKLPFKHRLARVLAFVLIDPEMGESVTIRGYKSTDAEKTNGKDDPRTSEIRFCKVKVLSGVDQETNGALTPKWSSEVRKVIPHYVGEYGGITDEGNFITGTDFVMYHHKKRDTYIAPSSNDYQAAATDFAAHGESSNYEQIIYKNTPCYDLIVEPSYSDATQVMYDEEGYYKSDGSIDFEKRDNWAATNNKIEFEVTLSNGLHYTREFSFNKLDANYQTVVYLRIHRESIDYDNSGSSTWKETSKSDAYYGVNNQNGNVLSNAGGSWQRAFRIRTLSPDNITDGSHYNEDKENDHVEGKDGQYLSVDKWKEAFLQAYQGGSHHGDYFVLDQNITINIPENFVFTGHLDGQCHKLNITDTSRGYIFAGLNGTYITNQENASPAKDDKGNVIYEANVHKESSQYWVPYSGYRAELLNTVFGCTPFASGASITGYINNCSLTDGTKIENNPTTIPVYK